MTETKIPGDKAKSGDQKATEKTVKPLTKVVVRRLPPSMTEATFLEQIQPVPEHDHMYFAPADWGLTVNATCRAYFNFVHQEDVFIFKEKFHGYIFVDAKGNEYPAVVEFAPFQRMGRTRSKKADRKSGTYETSEHFLNFCRTLDTEEAIPKLELRSDFEAKQDQNQRKMTPLLEFLNDKKSRRRDRDRKQQQQQQQQDKKGGGAKMEKKILAPIKEAEGKVRGENKSAVTAVSAPKKERPERSEKEKARRAERDKLRREKRNQLIDEKKKERQLLKQQKENATPTATAINDSSSREIAKAKENAGGLNKGAVTGTAEGQSNSNSNSKRPPPKEVKKYSERRQEQRAKQGNESKSAEKNNKGEVTKSAAVGEKRSSVVREGTSELGGGSAGGAPVGEKDKAAAEGKKKRESRRYSERRIRNKDRPAIQIYQPGSKVRKADGSAAEE